jgi:ABC-type Mn2+/Zn2+ transport systems, permease components
MMDWLSLLLPAWIMGTLLVFLTAPLGCLMLWRRMSFFADTMAHGTLLVLPLLVHEPATLDGGQLYRSLIGRCTLGTV